MPRSTVLVVDDFEPFRRSICLELEQNTEFPMIWQAVDGLEAIQKAEEFQPDLILLDISLPKLDGIAAARKIRQLTPKSKILFLTENTAHEIVDAALSTGARGYVVKSNAGDELTEAMKTVIAGGQFVSRTLGRSISPETHNNLPLDRYDHFESLGGLQANEQKISHRHDVQFYSNEAVFLDSFSNFIVPALRSGNVVVVIATESHRNSLVLELQKRGLDIPSAVEQGDFVGLDAVKTLSKFMVDGRPDPVRFSKFADDLIAKITRTKKGQHVRVSACGECAPYLLAQGNVEGAIRVEQLADELTRIYDLEIFCGYPMPSGEVADLEALEAISGEHTAIYSR